VLCTPQIEAAVVEELGDELRNRRDEAKDSIAVAQRMQKMHADENSSHNKEFEVGDLVTIRYSRMGPGYRPPKGHQHKLGPLGTPVRIVAKLSPLSYRVALPKGSRIHDVISIIHLRKFRGDASNIRPPPHC
jgi:hypothetical protein